MNKLDSKTFWELYLIIQRENLPELRDELRELEKKWELLEQQSELLKRGNISLRVAVIGDYSTGKSTFINSILGENFLPTGDLPTTKIITIIKYGDIPKAWLKKKDGSLIESNINELKNLHLQKNQEEIKDIDCIEIYYPNPLLKSIEIVDTPGFGDPSENKKEEYERLTHEEIKKADAFIFLFNANKLASASELQYLDIEGLKGKRIMAIINQMDLKYQQKHKEIMDWFKKKYGKKFEVVLPYSAKKILDSKIYEKFKEAFQNELPQVCINEGVSMIQIKRKDGEYIISAKRGVIKKKVVYEKKVKSPIETVESYYMEWFREALDIFEKFRSDMRKIIEEKIKKEREEFKKNIREFWNKLSQKLYSERKKYEKLKERIEKIREEIYKRIDEIKSYHLTKFKELVLNEMIYIFITEPEIKEGFWSTKYFITLKTPSDEEMLEVLKNYNIEEFISDIENSISPVEKLIEEFPEKEEFKKEYHEMKRNIFSFLRERHNKFVKDLLKSKNAIASWCMLPLALASNKNFTQEGGYIKFKLDEINYSYYEQYEKKNINTLIDMCIQDEVWFNFYYYIISNSLSLFFQKLIYKCDSRIESITENLKKNENREERR
jgi:GTPase Era involved in 16S rRNA processing